jgi:hypothetical protein
VRRILDAAALFLIALQLGTFATGLSAAEPTAAPVEQDPPKKPDAEQPKGASTKGDDKATPQQLAAKKTADQIIEDLTGKVPAGFAKDALAAINALVTSARVDQSSIYLFVRQVNRNIDSTKYCDDKLSEECKKVEDIRKITKQLVEASYSDSLHQNRNLSNQIQTRLPLLLADSVKLAATDQSLAAENRKLLVDFANELTLLSRRYLQSRRFRVGVGAEYFYFPRMSYLGSVNVDLSPFYLIQPAGSGGFSFLADFSNQTTPAVVLTGKIPFTQVDVSLPTQGRTTTLVTPVQGLPFSPSAAASSAATVLARSTVELKAKPEFDIGIAASVREILHLIRTGNSDFDTTNQWDVGIGVGTTGFRIDQRASTDVRVRPDTSKTFNELASSGTFASSKTTSFQNNYWRLNLNLQVSDELQIGVVARSYFKKTIDTGPVNIKGPTVGVTVIWFPTFGW